MSAGMLDRTLSRYGDGARVTLYIRCGTIGSRVYAVVSVRGHAGYGSGMSVAAALSRAACDLDTRTQSTPSHPTHSLEET